MEKATKTVAKKRPFYGGHTCYACDARPVGLRDRTPEGGTTLPACARHADPKIKTYDACLCCDGPVRKGSIVVDGDFFHASCYRAACN